MFRKKLAMGEQNPVFKTNDKKPNNFISFEVKNYNIITEITNFSKDLKKNTIVVLLNEQIYGTNF